MTNRQLAGPHLGQAGKVLARSTRALIREARSRYTTDLISWSYRQEFASVWQTVDLIPGWFHEGTAAVLYGIMRGERPTTVVEIGSYLGRSTIFFALAMQKLGARGRVVAID